MLGGEAFCSFDLVGSVGFFTDDLLEVAVVLGVAGPEHLGFVVLGESLLAVFADRLQQPVAGLGVVTFGHHKRTGHQRRQRIKHPGGDERLSPTHRLGRLTGTSTSEHRQTG